MPRNPLSETFSVEPHRDATALVCTAVPARGGAPYRHTCPLESFEAIAHAVEDAGDRGFDIASLHHVTGLPFTQVATALAFFRERGIIERRFKRNYAATSMTHLDAMVEYYALREGEAQEPPPARPAPDAAPDAPPPV